MQITIREDSILITGYVNAVERLSKPIKENIHGKVRIFLERIQAGTFKKALERNDNVMVLLNHNSERVLATTKDGSAKLEEDNIGLRAELTITDAEVVQKAKEGRLSGWSFGFYANEDIIGQDGDNETRTVTDLDLVEVSILDDTKSPAYYGTSIEAREEGKRAMSVRESNTGNNIMGNETNLEEIIEKVVLKVLEAQKELEAKANTQDPDGSQTQDPDGNTKRDYSYFEKCISNLR